jgi:membrane protein involved in colicin uptake
MTVTEDLKKYTDLVVSQVEAALSGARKPFYATVGAGAAAYDYAAGQARSGRLQEQAKALPTQLQEEIAKIREELKGKSGHELTAELQTRLTTLQAQAGRLSERANALYVDLTARGEQVVSAARTSEQAAQAEEAVSEAATKAATTVAEAADNVATTVDKAAPKVESKADKTVTKTATTVEKAAAKAADKAATATDQAARAAESVADKTVTKTASAADKAAGATTAKADDAAATVRKAADEATRPGSAG